jgi:hypothetical protein
MVSGDEVLAINGFRLTGSFSERLRQYEVGDQIELLMSRDGIMFSETVTIERRTSKDWSIGWVYSPSEEQEIRIAQWLETEPPKVDKDEDEEADEPSAADAEEEQPKKKRKRRRKSSKKS